MIVRMDFENLSIRHLPSDEHERACEALILALEMHITHFRDRAQEHLEIMMSGRRKIDELRPKSGIVRRKRREETKEKAHAIRHDTTQLARSHKHAMKERMTKIMYFQSLLEGQLSATGEVFPEVADSFRKSYTLLSELLKQPIPAPMIAALQTLPEKERSIIKLWMEIRSRLMQTIRSGRFSLPSMEDLGIIIPHPRAIGFSMT